uniref:Uncharacterized protein n=1 Tax=Nelumbo nucifera TaxID=4432 RepID=A0A822YL41_NELNU|nr:TPA_asm: hypothetical protein HUJ06_011664 [Nelumbo nucifera]
MQGKCMKKYRRDKQDNKVSTSLFVFGCVLVSEFNYVYYF